MSREVFPDGLGNREARVNVAAGAACAVFAVKTLDLSGTEFMPPSHELRQPMSRILSLQFTMGA
jgi:hypothetical protein